MNWLVIFQFFVSLLSFARDIFTSVTFTWDCLFFLLMTLILLE
uniref:Uncharacterized protein n=1 Tax=Arundo donax TaxID=35708 RepID=A0A0A8YAV1_ARUDO